MTYHFYAVLQKEGTAYNIYFPDLPGIFTYANNIEDALDMAQDALEGHLLVMEDDHDTIPKPSDFQTLSVQCQSHEQLQLIPAHTHIVRLREANKTVNKMVSLPQYLVKLGKEKNINFSQTLQRALKDELHL
ncbi:type II toxin-antitoxin system HicB family antitoxin [Staphylococcus sp. IVB6246]|uniref:type II toxin-antitoxin system HicB family antitoxin n=1 Tax=unclassified Staphylococcus TaxID=91994 RepID=UPI0021D34EFB|nr:MULTISPECIES: type II toxin-antitoxin system HicB family antitoxin [unclassified Staphylococcus]UXR69477.1 type II toxin-antitoxin system HicB family antitoxin [Staphylococcus sp. IVB6246]UXR71533.1 type II toxin-antitoxin system HicB family antitoxin [Staphylococcus sp. IVB6240]